jgi:hypothetical protein
VRRIVSSWRLPALAAVVIGVSIMAPAADADGNNPPTIVAEHRYNGGHRCTPAEPYRVLTLDRAYSIQALAADPDPDAEWHLTLEFAIWPRDEPAARIDVTTEQGRTTAVANARVPSGYLTGGRAYSWQVRVSDGVDTSAWSSTCTFVVDATDPGAPAVSSANYPPAGEDGVMSPIGEPGVFTLDAHGDTDAVAFQYAWEMFGVPGCEYGELMQLVCADPLDWTGAVPADAPGGTATVSLSPPRAASNILLVRTIDKAGNTSDHVDYRIVVPDTEPTGTVLTPNPVVGEPVTVQFSPHPEISGVTRYEYRVDGGETRYVAAAPDGTATVTFVLDRDCCVGVEFRSHSANGFVSTDGEVRVTVPSA